ncbi:MAG: hypothetical protein AVDCRST_MAG05-4906 [uncultured Rubrobacteraceae bacterium]|uniref:Uncharacterized protein n=1 Tax=uncultured Rubrobacteraceae bacterium TaxID=349277 RepID=A0A6J4U229_9ACTN|nr:MAG: hypothetical protein AVDCRST_MAG05-4906 [uncultured Rubrobacteraceae bacterium]
MLDTRKGEVVRGTVLHGSRDVRSEERPDPIAEHDPGMVP